ncbi:cysteine desulfurase [Methanobrevibacter arboriphilus JCM 13429 = DSM 1125]|uniref:cysteine desulfurase n=1 Tax=Methanobrevibacter arboriphilus JCM 13429 = DSM 1125 TaxID=1300164 RepID=A0A1V6N3U3_METAZ|nr:cysteine desulfurase [Methanobrevibacter arboriphilus]OQD59370.1 cysteine desulfurase [Methanobrevibacter arboriphilus JCM 13429 = DSM 1125]
MTSIEKIRNDFPILKNITYLDSASTSLTPKPVVEAIDDYYYNYNANIGRGAYKTAIKTGQKVENTREKIANLINASNDEIIFTQNTTSAINTLANGFSFEKNNNIVISNIEHHSNYIPWLNIEKTNDLSIDVKIAEADSNGIIDPLRIDELIDDNTKIVAITHVSNSIGSCQDIEEISKIVHEHEDVYILLDVAQSIGHGEIDIKKVNADFIAAPGHKGLLGPSGTGFLYGKKELLEKLSPTNLGGGTITSLKNKDFKLEEVPYRFEGGTQNISGIIGLGRAIEYINNIGISKIKKHTQYLTRELYTLLSEIDNVILYGDLENIFNIVSFNIKGVNPYDVSKILDETENICVRSGFHCAIPSLNLINANEGTVRASIHCYNNLNDIQKLVDCVNELSKFF